MAKKISVEQKPIEALHPHPNNPRTHPNEQIIQIANSIKEYGWTSPIIADEKGTVLAGHGRLYAAIEVLGLEEVPVITVKGLSDDQKRAYIIADNKLAANAEWKYEELLAEINYLTNAGHDIATMGFDDDDILGIHSMIDDTGFPDEIAGGDIIESHTEPTQLQGDGSPTHRQETMPEPGDNSSGEDSGESDKIGFTVELLERDMPILWRVLDGIISTKGEINTHAEALMYVIRAFDEDEESGDAQG